MDDSLDQTTLSTIGLLEARLLRLEHIIYGPSGAPDAPLRTSAVGSLHELERRFANLLAKTRVYNDLLTICNCPQLTESPRARAWRCLQHA